LDKTVVKSNPRPQRRKKTAQAAPEEDEVSRFFAVIDSPRDRAIFRLMYHAGLRASEIGMLEMRDYNRRRDIITIDRLKGSNRGEHHLCKAEKLALNQWIKVRGSRPGVMFASREHHPISRKMLHVLVRKYARKAELPRELQHCHMFKHACCTHLLSRGFNVEQVQDWVGHANIQNTMIYAKVTNSRRAEMAARLQDWR
jgi:site-specific recombinase XerD